ncbi:MAG: restriction endonuclease subunit S [Sulfurospirillaceae bacterium]|nr:restriction endonuclease subunit S [Sulfurospirillaceae bacterium]
MSKYQPYPQYKDSGVLWLGEVPGHWEVIRSKRLFSERNEKARNDDEQLTASQKYGIIYQKEFMDIEGRNVTQVLTGSHMLKHAEKGDFIISMRSFQGGLELCIYSGSISSAYISIVPNEMIIPKFFSYLFKSNPYIKALQNTSNLIRDGQALRFENFSQVDLILPLKNEQQAIANFLDNATCKIDTLIQKQQNLIELLKEKRQAAVENIIMQDKIVSMRLGMVVDQIFRPVDRKMEEIYIALGLYNRGRGLFHKEPKEGSELGDSDFYWIQNGDLILSGQFAWEGSVALAGKSENNCIVSHRYPVLRGKENIINTEYLWAFLTTKIGDFILNENSVGSAGRNRPLNINTLMKEKIPVPSLNEQLKISKIVQVEKKIIDSVSKTIELLNERRTALISATVTGKIDVREMA